MLMTVALELHSTFNPSETGRYAVSTDWKSHSQRRSADDWTRQSCGVAITDKEKRLLKMTGEATNLFRHEQTLSTGIEKYSTAQFQQRLL